MLTLDRLEKIRDLALSLVEEIDLLKEELRVSEENPIEVNPEKTKKIELDSSMSKNLKALIDTFSKAANG